MPLELRVIFEQLSGKDRPYTQNQLGELLKIDSSTVGRIRDGAMPEWRDHWRAFWIILALCKKHGIDVAPELKNNMPLEALVEYVDVVSKKANKGKTATDDAKPTRPAEARRDRVPKSRQVKVRH